VAAGALAALRAARGQPAPTFEPRLIGNGVLLALHWFAFFEAIQVANVAIGMLGYASFPLFVLLLERLFLGRRWARREAATAALVTAGLLLLVPEFSLANRLVHGLAWGLLSGFTFALLAVANRRWAAGRPATDIAFWQNLWAALALAPIALAAGAVPALGGRELALIVVLGLVCTAFAHRCSSPRSAASARTRRAWWRLWSRSTGSRSPSPCSGKSRMRAHSSAARSSSARRSSRRAAPDEIAVRSRLRQRGRGRIR
jgi:drug/metabolite transporter (DMT)-like permease